MKTSLPVQGMTLKQQAAVFNNASILIQSQGAALANFPYLPRGAVVVHIKHTDKYYEIHDFPRDLVGRPYGSEHMSTETCLQSLYGR